MDNFADLTTYQKQAISTILMSDLHLSLCEPANDVLWQAFFALLDELLHLPNLKQVFILGDWFEAWLGDDVAQTDPIQMWLQPMLAKLTKLSNAGCQLYVMHGNRDFLMGQKFCDKFGGKLINEPFFFTLNGKKIRLEHGDVLCTDDKSYQRFRKVIRYPLTKQILLSLPIKQRQKIANDLRQKSRADNAKKSMHIMDVNAQAVKNAWQTADILVHGHTHRPAEHHIDLNHSLTFSKTRLVLGDWRVDKHQVEAVIAVGNNRSLQLAKFFHFFKA